MASINYGSLVIAVVISLFVIIGIIRMRDNKRGLVYEDKLLLGIALLTLIMDPLRLAIIWLMPTKLMSTDAAFAHYIPDILFVVFALFWLMFFDYLANKSRTRVKRFFNFSILPIALLIIAAIGEMFAAKNITSDLQTYNLVYLVYSILRAVIVVAYMIVGYRTIRDFQSRRMEPLFLRLDFFIIPWLFGMVCVYVLHITTNSFWASISLLITYLAYKKRCRYVYRDNDAFREEFAPYFAAYVEKLHLKGECAFLIGTEGERDAISEVLDQCRPEKSFLLQRDDGTFMLYTMAKGKSIVELLEQTFRDTGQAHVPPVSLSVSHYIKNKDESSGDFIRRVIAAKRKTLME